MIRFLLPLALALAFALGCNGHSPSGTPDAPNNVDAKVLMDGNGSGLPKCTGMPYDPCNPAASNCMAGTTCHTFTGSNFTVCAPTCTTTCPMQGSTSITCNAMSLCKPPAPNATCSP